MATSGTPVAGCRLAWPAKGDGSDPHGESLLGNGASIRMLVILSVAVVAHPQEKKIFTSRDLRRVTCLIRIIPCGSNNITQKLYQPIGTN